MAKKTENKAADNKATEKLKKSIAPENIVMDDDSDMPAPETKNYNEGQPQKENYLKCSARFMSLIEKTLGDLPYNYILDNGAGKRIKLVDFVKYIEDKKDRISVSEMNAFLAFVDKLPFKYAREIMDVIDSKEQQATLWSLVE